MCEKMRRRRGRRWWSQRQGEWEVESEWAREEDREIDREKSIPAGNNCEQFPDPHHFLLLLYSIFYGLFFLDGWRRSRKERGTWIKIWVIADRTFIRPKPNCHHSALLSLKRNRKKKKGRKPGRGKWVSEEAERAAVLCWIALPASGPARWTDVTTPDSGGSGRCMQVCVFDKRKTQAPRLSISMSNPSFGGMEEKKRGRKGRGEADVNAVCFLK